MGLFPSNVELKHTGPLSAWRKIALGSWGKGGDPSVYGVVQIDATKILERRKSIRMASTGANGRSARVPTLTSIIGCATALTMKKHPNLNGLIRFGSISLREHVTLFFQTAVDSEGKELSGVKVEKAETKKVFDIMNEIDHSVQAVRSDQDPQFKRVKSQFRLVPPLFMKFLLNLTSFFIYTLNLDLRILGLPKDPFGSVMITNVGSLGIDFAFAPLVPYSRVPLLLAVGAIDDQPAVRNDEVVVVPQFNICGTFDLRLIDGVYAAKMMKTLRRYLETDEGLDELGFVVQS